jgi:ABC-2 type transport system ATP-binding protein
MNKEFVIDIQGLTKSFNDRIAVDNISISIQKGEVVGFLGPNGSGKTTTMRMLCGLLRPDKGQGTCLGYDIFARNLEIKHKIGYMTQKFSFYEDLTIQENLMFVARAYNLFDLHKSVNQTLYNLGLWERKDQLAGYLSGGWKQRLALAASIMHKPELLLLDEPTAGVDPKARREFWDQIHQLAQNGLTVLVSTHYMDEAERCHRIAYILYGKMIDVGSIDEVISRSRLSTWQIKGKHLGGLALSLKTMPGVDQVTYFGNALHVTGIDQNKLNMSMKTIQKETEYKINQTTTSLEDVFIHYMELQHIG